MTWNHRVIRSIDDDEAWFAVHEVYYDQDGDIYGWTGEVAPRGETLEELGKDIEFFKAALRKPILEEDTQGCDVVLREVGSR